MRTCAVLVALLALGCGGDDADPGDAAPDAGARADAAPADGGGADAEPPDGGALDAGPGPGSAGCGLASDLTPGEFVLQTLDVDGTTRDWSVWLPEGYDPERAYPVVYQLHGCSDNAMRENNNVPVQRQSGGEAIHVRGRAVDRCWDTSAGGPDVAFFDALVAAVEARFCADPERRWVTGYSGGSFMAHRLACERGDQIRGVATIAGGMPGRDCVGRVATLLIHDQDDETVAITQSERARDAHLERNGCGTERVATEPSPCEAYQGCDEGFPVVWCETRGMGHARQDDFAAPAFWDFLAALR